MKIHIVKKGDSLYELSKKYGVPLVKIVDANPQLVDPNKLDIGMKVKIPTEPVPVPEGSQPIIHKHAVKQGDSLWKLSKAWGVSLKEIIDANPQLKNPNALLVGEIVNIPAAGTFTNPGNNQHTGGNGHMPDKMIPGSKTYTGPKEEMTAPKEEVVAPKDEMNAPMPNMPVLPKIPMLPENEVKPEVNVKPEITIIPEITLKPEITIMPELVIKPENPILPPAEPICKEKKQEKPDCQEMHFVPAPELCPPFPECHEYVMPQQMDCYPSPAMMFQPAPLMMFPESPCGCKDHMMASHDWHGPQHMMHPGENEMLPGWGAPNSPYPGITEQPMTLENNHLNIAESYMSGMSSMSPNMIYPEQDQPSISYESGMGMAHHQKSPCGCHGGTEVPTPYAQGMMMNPSWGQMHPHHQHHVNYLHHFSHCQFPIMPCCCGVQPYSPWPVYGMEGMAQTMGNSAFPQGGIGTNYPLHGENVEHPKKDCGCHGRQEDEPESINVTGVESFDTEYQEELVDETEVEAKVSRERRTRVKPKSTPKKSRKEINKPKRKNPWIKG